MYIFDALLLYDIKFTLHEKGPYNSKFTKEEEELTN